MRDHHVQHQMHCLDRALSLDFGEVGQAGHEILRPTGRLARLCGILPGSVVELGGGFMLVRPSKEPSL